MRTRELFLASIMAVTFGCPSDDTGDTTEGATEHMPTTGDQHETTGDHDSSAGVTEGSSSDGGAESSSSGGGESSSSGGDSTGGSADCAAFCTGYFATCGDDPGNDYGDVGACETACAGFSQDGFDCRTMHLDLAMGDAATHCPHASNGGGGVCSD